MKVNGGVYFHRAGMISFPPTFPGWHVQSNPLYQLMSVGRPRAAVPARSSVNASRGGGAVSLPVPLSLRSCPGALRPPGSGLGSAPAFLPLPSRFPPSSLPLPSLFLPASLPLPSHFPPRFPPAFLLAPCMLTRAFPWVGRNNGASRTGQACAELQTLDKWVGRRQVTICRQVISFANGSTNTGRGEDEVRGTEKVSR